MRIHLWFRLRVHFRFRLRVYFRFRLRINLWFRLRVYFRLRNSRLVFDKVLELKFSFEGRFVDVEENIISFTVNQQISGPKMNNFAFLLIDCNTFKFSISIVMSG